MAREDEIYTSIAAGLADIDGDRSALELVADIPLIESATESIVADRVAAARAQGLSWHAIAQRLGISRQAAHKRFGKAKGSKRSKRGVRLEVRLDRDNR